MLAAAVLAFLAAMAPSPVAAHAELITSEPAANAVLPDGPELVRISFTEPVDPSTAFVDLLGPEQETIDGVGPPEVEDGTTLLASLPELAPGLYTVSYQVVSTVDGHATAGIFSFLVDPSGTEPAPVEAARSTSPAVDPMAIGARWIGLAGALVALGALVMWLNAGRASLASLVPRAGRGPPMLLVGVAAGVAFVATAAYVTLAARPIAEALGSGHGAHADAGISLDPAAPFGWTPFAIAMRVALAGTLLATVAAIGTQLVAGSRAGIFMAAMVALLLGIGLAGMSMAGHAAATGGPIFGAIDWLHLVAAAAWLGGLPAAVALARRARAVGEPLGGVARDMLRRHGRVALVAGPLVALTGIANSPLVLGNARELVASSYGNLLVAKAVLLSAALGIGAANHFLLRGRGRGRVALLVVAELAIAALAVLTAATMVTVQPAAARQPGLVAPPFNAAHLYGNAGPSSVHASAVLPAPGNQRYQVTIADLETGQPRDDVQKVFLTFVPPSESALPEERVELTPDPGLPGLYATSGAYTPVTGEWNLEVTVRRAGALDESVAFALPVSIPPPPERVPPPQTGIAAPTPLAVAWAWLPSGGALWAPALAVLALIVAVSAAIAAARRRGRTAGWLAPLRAVLLGAFLVIALTAGSKALVAAANRVPAEAAGAESPVPPHAESIERGHRLYLANCASCHGRAGDGQGAASRLAPPAPLEEVVPRASSGELSYRIANGLAGTAMPPFAGTLTEEERWDLVNYLEDRWGARPR